MDRIQDMLSPLLPHSWQFIVSFEETEKPCWKEGTMEEPILVLGGLGENNMVLTGALVFLTSPRLAATQQKPWYSPAFSLTFSDVSWFHCSLWGHGPHSFSFRFLASCLMAPLASVSLTGSSCPIYSHSVDAPCRWPSALLFMSLSAFHCMTSSVIYTQWQNCFPDFQTCVLTY